MSNVSKLQPWKVLHSKIVHSTPWIEIIEDTCLAGQKELVYTYTRRVDEGPMILVEDQNEKLWMVRQYRHPIKKIVWQFPAEGKFSHESWEEAAKRGVEEELGFQVIELKDLGLYHPDPGGLDQKTHVFLAKGIQKSDTIAQKHQEDEVEELEIHAFSRAEIDEMIDAGEICDNWTLAALFLYDRFKRRVL